MALLRSAGSDDEHAISKKTLIMVMICHVLLPACARLGERFFFKNTFLINKVWNVTVALKVVESVQCLEIGFLGKNHWVAM